MFTGKKQRLRSLEAELQEQKALNQTLINRVNRLERDVADARNDSRNRERAQAPEAAGLRE